MYVASQIYGGDFVTFSEYMNINNFVFDVWPKIYLILYPSLENLTSHIAITENLTKITMENDLNQGRIDWVT